MMKMKKILSVVLAVLMIASCAGIAASAKTESAVGKKGSFDVISYNIAGLPIPSSETEDGRDALTDNLESAAMLNNMGYDIIALLLFHHIGSN